MCGIFGIFLTENSKFDLQTVKTLSDSLFIHSASRGKEASGYGLLHNGVIEILRRPAPSNEIINSIEYQTLFNQLDVSTPPGGRIYPFALIGHSRLATSGFHGLNLNNQPINTEKIIGVHNGVIANYIELIQKYTGLSCKTDNDSEIVFRILQNNIESNDTLGIAVLKLFQEIQGSASIAALLPEYNHLLLATNHGSLFYAHNIDDDVLVFASEKYILQKSLGKIHKTAGIKNFDIRQIHANNAYGFDILGRSVRPYKLNDEKSAANLNFTARKDAYSVFDRLVMEQEARDTIRRCSRCLLTETMPFIKFDDKGECNFCKKYKKQILRPHEELEKILTRYPPKNNSADCIIGFSGGRDSSYALHYLTTVLGMKPVAYTYDWGMVNDLARRNQARIVGKLGVEHIIIAAPIQQKLANIRRNLKAWMKRPDLGMIPIFMAGDKHFFIYLNRLHKQTGIQLRVWANNRLERVEFKYGFAGIYQKEGVDVRTKTPLINKAKLAAYYLKKFASNPGYLNRSIPDTLTGFYSYYFARQDFINIYDYIAWDERTIIETLKAKYNWETAQDSPVTWRIGDGTAAFYNFIYYTVAGFTENDVFRSNQIREGMIDRDEALHIVRLENQPRFESISEYCNDVGVDFNEVLKVVESMPKLYWQNPA